jgi:hypothetical protein
MVNDLVGKLGIEGLKFLFGLQKVNDETFSVEVKKLYEDWVIEIDKALRILARDFFDLDNAIERQFQDRQFMNLMRNFRLEAAREAMDERRKMLAHAAAGACMPTIDLGRRARLERTIRELDPDDVRGLYGLKQIVGRYDLEGKDHVDTDRLRHHVLTTITVKESLLAAGVVQEGTHAGWGGGWTFCRVTHLGLDTLSLLKTYLIEKGASFSIPGRQKQPEDRTENEIREILDNIPRVKLLFDMLDGIERVGKQYNSPVCRAPKEKDKEPYLLFNVFALDRRAEFEESKQSFSGTEIRFEIEDGWDGCFQVKLYGRHDLLRLLADDFDIGWF